jgi:hypothetical protein
MMRILIFKFLDIRRKVNDSELISSEKAAHPPI